MPIRIPTQTVIVQRNGANFAPKLGEPFNFTTDEVEEINTLAPDALRKPVNEEAKEVQQAPAAAGKAGKGAKGAAASTGADDL